MSGEPEIEIGYRLLIPVMHVGAIIGRHGEAIAQLRQRTGARVKVHDAHDGEHSASAVCRPCELCLSQTCSVQCEVYL